MMYRDEKFEYSLELNPGSFANIATPQNHLSLSEDDHIELVGLNLSQSDSKGRISQ